MADTSRRAVRPQQVKYIKLGVGGEWEKECIEMTHTLRLGFSEANHGQCLARKWEPINRLWLRQGHDPSKATRFTNEIKTFYESDESVLWITFYKQLMWWCFSAPVISLLSDKTKTRPANGGWKCKSIDGKMLDFEHLSDDLLKMRLYKGTTCSVRESEYVLNKINARDVHDGRFAVDLTTTAEKTTDEGYFSPATLQDERKRRLTEIVERRGQPEFRNKLISAYQGRCAVTGSDALAALEAAHIIPYCGPKSDHISNGLLLRADIHTLFDLYLIGIHPKSLTVALGPVLKNTSYSKLEGKTISVPMRSASRPNSNALGERWLEFSKK